MLKVLVPAAVLLSLATQAAQAQMCEGTVHGLSSRYNPATGSGFLAVRAAPKSSARQVGELFNGDVVEITNYKRGWFFVNTENTPMVEGWVSRKYIATDCEY